MSNRIRWNDGDGPLDPGQSAVGMLGPFSFSIGWMSGSKDWRLYAELPGMGFRSERSDDRDALKAQAERWLEEFVSSLGAIFPDAVLKLADEWEADAAELDRDIARARKSPHSSDHHQARTDEAVAGELRNHAGALREAITRELTGKEPGDDPR